MPYLRNLNEEDATYAIREVYERVFGNYLRARNIAHELLRVSYY